MKGSTGIITVFVAFLVLTFASAAVAEVNVDFYGYTNDQGYVLSFYGGSDSRVIRAEVYVNGKRIGAVAPSRINSRNSVPGVKLIDTGWSVFNGDIEFTRKGSYIIGIKSYNDRNSYQYNEIRRVFDDVLFEFSWAYQDCTKPGVVTVEYYGQALFGFAGLVDGSKGKIQLGNYEYPATLSCYDGTYCTTSIEVDETYFKNLIAGRSIDTFFRQFPGFVTHTEINYPIADNIGMMCDTGE